MLKKKSVFCIGIYIIMLPFCFKIVKAFEVWKNGLFEDLTSLNVLYLLRLLEGGLYGLFILIMLGINECLLSVSRKGIWFSIFITGANLLVAMLPLIGLLPEIGILSFCYFEIPNYVSVITMLLLFLVVRVYFLKKEEP